MYCKECGKKTGENDKFCSHCGEKIFYDTKEQKSLISENQSPKTKKLKVMLRVIEIVLWVGMALISLGIFLDEIDWWSLVTVEIMVISAIGYIKGWYKTYEIPLVLMIIGIINNLLFFSIPDVVLFSLGFYGVILKKREIEVLG